MSNRLKNTIQQVLAYAMPISVAQLVRILTPVLSTAMVAKLGVMPLAANSLVASYYLVPMLFGFGLAFSITIQTGEQVGKADHVAATKTLVNGLWLGVGTGVVIAVLYLLGPIVLRLLGQDPALIRLTPVYFIFLAIGIVPYLFLVGLQQFLIAIGRPRLLFRLSALTTLVSLSFNYLFIFGVGQWHGLGLTSLGLSFLLTAGIVLVATIACLMPHHQLYPLFKHLWQIDLKGSLALFKLGWPIGLNMVVELGAVSILVLMIGWVNHFGLAAYQIVWQYLLIVVMIPFGISQATTALVSQAMGAKDACRVKQLSYTAIGIGVVIMLLMALIFVFFNHALIGLFLKPSMDHEALVATIAHRMLYVSAFYQVFDVIRIVSVGSLRGMRDTHVPLLVSFVGYWLIGIPVAAIFGFGWQLGAVGMWLGLSASVVFCSIVLFIRLRKRLHWVVLTCQ